MKGLIYLEILISRIESIILILHYIMSNVKTDSQIVHHERNDITGSPPNPPPACKNGHPRVAKSPSKSFLTVSHEIDAIVNLIHVHTNRDCVLVHYKLSTPI